MNRRENSKSQKTPLESSTSTMFKSTLHVVAGLLAGCIVVGLIESASHAIWPPPEFFSKEVYSNPEKLAEQIALVPLPAKISVLVGWAFGSLTGGFVSAKLAGRSRPARSVGIVMLAMIILNLMTIPHPLWMSIGGILAPLPAARIGARQACKVPK